MKNWLTLLLISVVVVSCLRDKQTTWDTQMLTPLAKSQLTVNDLLNSDDITANPDSSLKLVYSTEMFSMNTDSFVELPDSAFEFGASLETLELPNDTVEYRITMGDIARSLGGLPGALILGNHNGSLPGAFLANPVSVNGQQFEISMDDLFDELELDTGNAIVIIENGLPLDISDLQFQLSNAPQPGGDTIIEKTFASIPKNTTQTENFPLDDVTILSQLVADLIEMKVSSSDATIPIDTNDAIVAKIIVKDLKPISATATWPDQNVINQVRLVPFAPNIQVDFRDAIIREGEIYFEIFSSLQDSIYITYTVPNVQLPGTNTPFKIDTVVPPAPPGGFSSLSKTYPVAGYEFTFNGYGIEDEVDGNPDFEGSMPGVDPDRLNAYVTVLEARIQYTGIKKTLSLDDTVFANAQVRGLKPEIAYGYLNNKKVDVGPSSINFDLFSKIKSGQIELEDVLFEIEVDNGIGASAVARFNEIKGENARGDQVNLNFFGNNDTMQINAATEIGTPNNFTGASQHTISKRSLTPDTSNIDAFIENLPNKITYSVEVELNANETKPSDAQIISNPPNFVYYEDDIDAKINMEIPLSVVTDSLVLVDTMDFDINTPNGNQIESGTFSLLINNGFPFDASTSLYFLDEMGTMLDSLWVDQTISRANVDANGKVSSKTQTEIQFEISKEKMDVIKTASLLYVKSGFHTFDLTDSQKKFYKIYSHYSFDVKLVGDFKYQLSN